MWVDVIAICVLCGGAFLGALRGGPEAAFRLVALFVTYAVAALAAHHGSGPLSQELGIGPWVAAALAGVGGLLASSLVLSGVGVGVRQLARARRGGAPPGSASRAVGAMFGFLRAGILVAPLLWMAHLAQGVRETGVADGLPDLAGARTPAVIGSLARAGAEGWLDDPDPGARLTARFVAEPGAMAESLDAVLEHPRVTDLQRDGDFWRLLESGRVDEALRQPSFVAAAHDSQLRDSLHELGVIEDGAAADPRLLQRELRDVMAEVGSRMGDIRRDPAVEELLEDPQFRDSLESGDTLRLLAHPGFQQLVARIGAGSVETP